MSMLGVVRRLWWKCRRLADQENKRSSGRSEAGGGAPRLCFHRWRVDLLLDKTMLVNLKMQTVGRIGGGCRALRNDEPGRFANVERNAEAIWRAIQGVSDEWECPV